MPIDQHSMDGNEAGCTRAFHAVTKNTGTVEQVTGFYVKRLFRSNFLDILTQTLEEAYEGDDGIVDEEQWSHWAEEVTTLQVSSEEDAKAKFDEFVFVYDRDGFFEIDDDPSVTGLYDQINGVVHIMSDALGNRTMRAEGLDHVKALYSEFVEESKEFEKFESEN